MIFQNYEKVGLELDKLFNAHKDKTRERQEGTYMDCVHDITKTKEEGMGIYTRGFPGILWEAQLGITLSLSVVDEEKTWILNMITMVWAPYMAKYSKHYHVL